MMKVFSKRGYEFSFAWIFAIFAGAVIIFFAIYFAMQLVGQLQLTRDVTQGKSLGILLTPIETEIEEGKFATIYLTDPTRMYFECKPPVSSNPFGSQNLWLSIKPPLGSKWEPSDSPPLTFHNKYFFPSAEPTENENVFMSEGDEKFYVLSRPLYLPFKVADMMILYSDKKQYCFTNAPLDFKKKLQQINMTNVFFSNCNSNEQTIICFEGASGPCNITVIDRQNKVTKNGEPEPVFYLESSSSDPYAMLYAAIFSDSETYGCQVKRLMAHTSKLLDIYYSKSERIELISGGCSQNLQSAIISFNDIVSRAAETGDLSSVKTYLNSNPNFLSGGNICALF